MTSCIVWFGGSSAKPAAVLIMMAMAVGGQCSLQELQPVMLVLLKVAWVEGIVFQMPSSTAVRRGRMASWTYCPVCLELTLLRVWAMGRVQQREAMGVLVTWTICYMRFS
jgi:hypothetical protein